MKRIVTLLAVLLLAACTDLGILPQDGRYAPNYAGAPNITITISGGQCAVIDWDNYHITDVTTSGHYPKYKYTASSSVYQINASIRFTEQNIFTADIKGSYIDGPVSMIIDNSELPFINISANFQQTKNGSN
jgi:hypothetical protein